MPVLERFFRLGERRTTAGREVRGAVATFLTMAYILFVNPNVLAPESVLSDPSVPAAAKMPRESVLACTALAAGVCCILMGLVANFPIAMASGMGLNATIASLYFTGRVPSWRHDGQWIASGSREGAACHLPDRGQGFYDACRH